MHIIEGDAVRYISTFYLRKYNGMASNLSLLGSRKVKKYNICHVFMPQTNS